MKKEQRIKKNPEFQQVFREGSSMANRQFVLYYLKRENQTAFRVGLSVSKKVGNAVVRNRIKRYIRQAFLELSPHLRQDADYIVIARKPAADFNFHQTKNSLIHVMGKAKVLQKKVNSDK
ncbi:ribonuclease P protein component [Jeotgalibacillus proteolyticus]|uniref:Ribonuclease P protein component n=1 Tax=Jeotgalibacillus proteolyticus TaxID=2082395 RepID=A0A2S5G6C0_9BACL|nr:ribonuclease P protein component [Jeotgalibacillus proteolyticus]PPA68471.1 ribonuclease P protein component [Jeotgalibacillus proteolyticus]